MLRRSDGGRAQPGLHDVLALVGNRSTLDWFLADAWLVGSVVSVWPALDHREVEDATAVGDGLAVSWPQHESLARSGAQVVDGRLTGYDADGQPVLQLEAVDSSCWIVWAADGEQLLHLVRECPGAEPSEEREPAPRSR